MKPWDSTKGGEFRVQLSDHQLLKKSSAQLIEKPLCEMLVDVMQFEIKIYI
jgi:hypothetical protein